MKATYFLPLPLALATLANATPRIDQISPVTGLIEGKPVAYDLDDDGDLDILYLTDSISTPHSLTSTWLENLGDRRFSAPRTLGHSFTSSTRSSYSETIIQPPTSSEPHILHLSVLLTEARNELFSRPATSPSTSWKKIHQFDERESAFFLQSPNPDLQVVFSHTLDTDRLLIWQAYSDSLSQVGQIILPSSSSDSPENLQAADFDQDGDSDLILEYRNSTLIYQRTGPFQFAETPITVNLSNPTIGDLNLDGIPDLFNNRFALNAGDFNFSSSNFPFNTSPFFPTSQGKLGSTPLVVQHNPNDGSAAITIYQAPTSSNSASEIPFEIDSDLSSAPLVADFDQDGNSDITYISRTAPQSIVVRSNRDFVSIPGIPDFISSTWLNGPYYDQVMVSWGQESDFTSPSPATSEAPILCSSPAVGDYNNDGFLDLVVGPDINGQARILLNDGHGNFTDSRLLTELQTAEFETGVFHLQDFVPVDLNGDGNLDLSFSINRPETNFSSGPTLSACAIALGDGQGSFAPVTLPPGSFEIITEGFCGILEFKDFDNDGDPDAILPGAWRENVNGTLRQSAYPLIQNAATSDALGNPINVSSQQIADVDGDGSLDILIPALTRDILDPLLVGIIGGNQFPTFSPGLAFNNGNGGIQNIADFPAGLLGIDALGNPLVLPYLALDLDLDGQREILTSERATDALGNPTVSRVTCHKLDSSSPRDLSLAETISYPPFSLPFSDQLLDFNGDGELEYVSADRFITPTTRGPLLSPRYNFRSDHLASSSNPALTLIAVADFDNDGDADALYATGFSGLHLVRNTIVDEDSPITNHLITQGMTPAQASPQADPDGDGRSNALELIQGSDPLTADQASPEFQDATLSFNGTHLSFQQLSDAADFDIHYDVEVSNDLINWSRTSSPSPALLSTQGIWDKVSVAITPHTRKNYYRIHTTHDPRR